MTKGTKKKMKRIDPEIIFAVRMMMARFHLTPADMLRILVELEKKGE